METTPQVFSMGVNTSLQTSKTTKAKAKLKPKQKPKPKAKPNWKHALFLNFSSLKQPIYRFARHPWLLTNPMDPIALLAIVQAVHPKTKEPFESISSILAFLKHEFQRQKNESPFRISFPGTIPETLQSIKNAIQHVKKNQRQLVAFRKLALRWLETRRLKAGNDEDLVTGEVPKTPVSLIVWPERRKYVFEPDTIRRDMIERLFQHSYLFPKFLLPRNPYTNCELSVHQFSCIMRQLRAAGKSHWVLEALLKCKYDVALFKKIFGDSVKRELVLKVFRDPFTPDTLDIILDFIEDAHDDNTKYFDQQLYRWAFENKSKNIKIKRWIQLCKEYQLLLSGYTENYTVGVKKVRDACVNLCAHPVDIECERNIQRADNGLDPIILAREGSAPLLQTSPIYHISFHPSSGGNEIYVFTGEDLSASSGDETPASDVDSP